MSQSSPTRTPHDKDFSTDFRPKFCVDYEFPCSQKRRHCKSGQKRPFWPKIVPKWPKWDLTHISIFLAKIKCKNSIKAGLNYFWPIGADIWPFSPNGPGGAILGLIVSEQYFVNFLLFLDKNRVKYLFFTFFINFHQLWAKLAKMAWRRHNEFMVIWAVFVSFSVVFW